MKFRVISTIFSKEILITFRDKRTLLMMIGVPVLLYPVVLIVGVQIALLQQQHLETTISRVAIAGENAPLLRHWLRGIDKIQVTPSSDPPADLAAGNLEAWVSGEEDLSLALAEDRSAQVNIYYDRTDFESREATLRLEEGLATIQQRILARRLETAGIASHFIQPILVAKTDTAPARKATGTLLGLILPVLMVIMVALGAFYPAVDLTAGEKERGTFETLLSTPAAKFEIVCGKFLAVFLLAMITGVLNLASMALTFMFLLSQVQSLTGVDAILSIELPFGSFFIILMVLVPLAFFICALMMSIAVFARSFKEAQNYLTPFFLLITMPAIAAGLPGVELNAFNSLIPIANVVLLFRGLMIGAAGFQAVVVVFLSSTAFAVLALLFAAWLFQREEVVLSEERGIPLTWRRSRLPKRDALTPAFSLGLFAFTLVLIFFLGSLAQQRALLSGLLFTEWLLVLAPPLALLWLVRADFRKALHLQPITSLQLLSSCLCAAGAFILLIQVGIWNARVLPGAEELEAQMGTLFAQGESGWGLALLLFTVAFSPAFCEEILFRGALLSGLRTRLHPIATVLLVGLLFGLFHITIFRIIPTGLMGILLSYLVLRTGTLLAGITVHVLFNGLGVLFATGHIPELISTLMQVDHIESHGLPPEVFLIGLGLFLFGLAGIEAAALRRKQ